MIISHYPDYLFSKKINNINNAFLVKDCLDIEEMLIKTFPKIKTNWHGSLATVHHQRYNLLTFPTKEINQLYFELQKIICPYLENKIYYIKSWLNVFRKGQKVDWHDHWSPEKKVWHGFYCAQVGESYTEYKIPNVKKTIKIISKEGLIVFGKSDGDKHRSSEWKEQNYPRITLAFDIVPLNSIESKLQGNHFIPFKNE
jgi:hypothetical protein